jgi:hypothetical protein
MGLNSEREQNFVEHSRKLKLMREEHEMKLKVPPS